MRRSAWLVLVLGCGAPVGPAPVSEPPELHPAAAVCEPVQPIDAWERATMRMPALLEHSQLDRAAERFEALRAWFPERGRATVWLRAEEGETCRPVEAHLTLERIRGRWKAETSDADRRREERTTVELEPWGISAWFMARDGAPGGETWSPYEHAILPTHTPRYLSAIDDRVAVYGGRTYRLTTTCIRRETRYQQCEDGATRHCPVCSEIGLRTIGTQRSTAHRTEPYSTVVEETGVDCTLSCPPDEDAAYRGEIDATLRGRVFYADGGDGVRVYRYEADCQAEVVQASPL